MDALPRETFSIINPTIEEVAAYFDVNGVGALYDINPKHKDVMLERFKAVSDYLSTSSGEILSVHYFKEIKGLYFHTRYQKLEIQRFGGFKGNESVKPRLNTFWSAHSTYTRIIGKLDSVAKINKGGVLDNTTPNIINFFDRQYKSVDKKQAEKARQANETFEGLVNIDDVFYAKSCRGYVVFYQVVGLKGKKTVLLREIKTSYLTEKYQRDGSHNGIAKPRLNEFVSERIYQKTLELHGDKLMTKAGIGYYGSYGTKVDNIEQGIKYCYVSD